MAYNNDFEAFIRECIYFAHGKMLLKNLNKLKYSSNNGNLSESEASLNNFSIPGSFRNN